MKRSNSSFCLVIIVDTAHLLIVLSIFSVVIQQFVRETYLFIFLTLFGNLSFYLFSIWGIVMFATSVVFMDKYGNQLAI